MSIKVIKLICQINFPCLFSFYLFSPSFSFFSQFFLCANFSESQGGGEFYTLPPWARAWKHLTNYDFTIVRVKGYLKFINAEFCNSNCFIHYFLEKQTFINFLSNCIKNYKLKLSLQSIILLFTPFILIFSILIRIATKAPFD